MNKEKKIYKIPMLFDFNNEYEDQIWCLYNDTKDPVSECSAREMVEMEYLENSNAESVIEKNHAFWRNENISADIEYLGNGRYNVDFFTDDINAFLKFKKELQKD